MHRRLGFEEWVSALALALMLGLVCVEIVMRGAFGASFLWSEEVARYLMLWSVYFGASAAVASGEHLRIELLLESVRPSVRRLLETIAQLWVFAFSLAITFAGYLYVADSFRLGFVSADSNLPIRIGWVQLVIPITFALSALHAARQFGRLVARARGAAH